ncbi:PH domain-containing protein [Gloeobacter morelensis]|uniref:PH domain-containing protein n=1 Tax=Gloeobacter morelensis MG652769 TaxID=2781736 RepID=A0ABY3PG29_9CYAN|nr:PH domain-containing protein [Gloeobacter morelensis]UFP92599.1 PH domain-containing protein [Gloeobacter morelensis MG652769]
MQEFTAKTTNIARVKLFDDESVLLEIRPFVWMYVSTGPSVLIAGITSLPLAGLIAPQMIDYAVPLGLALTLGGAALTGWQWLCWLTTAYVLTTHRLVTRAGVLAPCRRNVDLSNLQNVESSKVLGFDFGTIFVETAGEDSEFELKWIEALEATEAAILTASERRKMTVRPALQRRPGRRQLQEPQVAGYLEDPGDFED